MLKQIANIHPYIKKGRQLHICIDMTLIKVSFFVKKRVIQNFGNNPFLNTVIQGICTNEHDNTYLQFLIVNIIIYPLLFK